MTFQVSNTKDLRLISNTTVSAAASVALDLTPYSQYSSVMVKINLTTSAAATLNLTFGAAISAYWQSNLRLAAGTTTPTGGNPGTAVPVGSTTAVDFVGGTMFVLGANSPNAGQVSAHAITCSTGRFTDTIVSCLASSSADKVMTLTPSAGTITGSVQVYGLK